MKFEHLSGHKIKSIELALNCLERKGVTKEVCLRNTEIDLEMISNPEVEISLLQELEFYKNVAAIDFEHPIGLEIGEEHKLENYGIWGLAIMSAANLRESVLLASEYQSLTYTFFDYTFIEAASVAIFELKPLADYGTCLPVLADRDISATILLFAQVIGQALPLTRVSLMQPPDSNTATYEEYFKCRVEHSADTYRFAFSLKLLDFRLPQSNPATAEFCAIECARLAEEQRKGATLADRIHQRLSLCIGNFPSPETLALEFGLSYRSLRRKLKEEGVSFREIQDKAKYNLAKKLLINRDETLAEIGSALGFSEPGNFSHAFKRWSGVTPRDYRKHRTHK